MTNNDKKISQLSASTSLIGNEAIPIVQDGITKKTTALDIANFANDRLTVVTSINTQTGTVVLTKSNIGLGNVDNTSDLNKPISTATATALGLKANLSTLASVSITGSYNDLVDRPALGSAAAQNSSVFATSSQGSLADSAIQPGDIKQIAFTGDPKDLDVKIVQVIPAPKISLAKNLINELDIEVNWGSGDKNFLLYSPKYYLFRYCSSRTSYRKGQGYKKNNKRFRHPVHMNGVNAIHTGWWGSADHDSIGTPLPARTTEWEVPQLEGERIFLNLNSLDWAKDSVSVGAPLEKHRRTGTKFRGCNRTNTSAFFFVCIGIELPNTPSTGCPITFGPPSPIFQLFQNRTDRDITPIGSFDKYCWKLAK